MTRYRFRDPVYKEKESIYYIFTLLYNMLIGRRPSKMYYKNMNLERIFRVIYFFTSAYESLNVYVYVRTCIIIFLNFYRMLFQKK